MQKRIVVIGGGVAGLSVAHELADRNFAVTVYERRETLGGKARSVDAGGGGKKGFPGEHGFRFFPGWYRHLAHTMKRIPCPKTGGTAYDNLVPAAVNMFAAYDQKPFFAPLRRQKVADRTRTLRAFHEQLTSLGITYGDILFFLGKLAMFIAIPEGLRRERFDGETWWEFMEADRRSTAFRKYLVTGITQNSVAAKAKEASAYTIAKMAVQTLVDVFDPRRDVDRVLNGPTNEAWIDPWVAHLKSKGVVFKTGYELESIELDRDKKITRVWLSQAERRRRLRAMADELRATPLNKAGETAELVPAIFALIDEAAPVGWRSFSAEPAAARKERIADELQRLFAVSEVAEEVRNNFAGLEPVLKLQAFIKAPIDGDVDVDDDDVRDARAAVTELVRQWLQALVERQREAVDTLVKDLEERLTKAGDRGKDAAQAWSSGGRGRAALRGELRQLLYARQVDRARDKVKALLSLLPHDVGLGLPLDPAPLDELGAAWKAQRELVDGLFVHADGRLAGADDAYVAESDAIFVFALPVEQMAYYVHRSRSLGLMDPDLKKLIPLSDHVDWMAGIQFFLNERVDITQGHIDCLDSEWHLTALSQTQFWPDVELSDYGDGTLRSILSVDISAWDKKGSINGREAWNCTKEEIAEEVWRQLERSLNTETTVIHKGMWCQPISYFLDDSIVDRYDRKKQAFYDRFRSVRFSSGGLVRSQKKKKGQVPISRAFGDRLQVNVEPLLINRAGSWELRPEPQTRIRNMFLAADYVRTDTNLTCMEGANEAARLAVNEILKAVESNAERCQLFPTMDPASLLVLEPLLAVSRVVQGTFAKGAAGFLNSVRDVAERTLRTRIASYDDEPRSD